MKMAEGTRLLSCPPSPTTPAGNPRDFCVRPAAAASSVGGDGDALLGLDMGREGEARSFGEMGGY